VSALSKNGIQFGNNVSIGAFSRIIVSTTLNNLGDKIVIGNSVGIGEYASIGGAGGLEIGDECIVGPYLSCHPENHNYSDLTLSIRHQGVNRKGIKIGQNCWIGSKVTILDGVQLGNGCIIAAGAVVTKSFPDNSIIGGVPAKLINTRGDEIDMILNPKNEIKNSDTPRYIGIH
jgi:acetyltransferase-like isoleucine patch superfamily enzyme